MTATTRPVQRASVSAGTAHPVAAIVDPYGSGQHLATAFAERGWFAVAVHSRPDHSMSNLSDLDDCYLQAIVHGGDLHATTTALSRRGVGLVLAGAESGAALADALADRLGLADPGAQSVRLSRSRAQTYLALAASHLTCPDTKIARSQAEAAYLADRIRLWPVAVKPDSGGAATQFCADPPTLIEAARRVLSRHGAALVQQVLTGEHYTIASVSADSEHHIVEVWRETRRTIAGRPIPDRSDLLASTHPCARTLTNYVADILRTLAIRQGPVLTEVVLTTQGPVLVNVAAQLPGHLLPVATRTARGGDLAQDVVDALVAPHRLAGRANERAHLPCTAVSLQAPASGNLRSSAVRRLRELPTLAGHLGDLTAHTGVQRTVNTSTSPATLFLVDEDPCAVERDYAAVRRIEQGLYLPDAPARRNV